MPQEGDQLYSKSSGIQEATVARNLGHSVDQTLIQGNNIVIQEVFVIVRCRMERYSYHRGKKGTKIVLFYNAQNISSAGGVTSFY